MIVLSPLQTQVAPGITAPLEQRRCVLHTHYAVPLKQHQHSTMNILNETEMIKTVAKEGCGTDYTASGTGATM